MTCFGYRCFHFQVSDTEKSFKKQSFIHFIVAAMIQIWHCCGTNMLGGLIYTLIYCCCAKQQNLFKAIWGQRTISKGGFRESAVSVTATDWTWVPLLCHYRAKWEGTDKACCVLLSSGLPRLLLRGGESPRRTAAGQLPSSESLCSF